MNRKDKYQLVKNTQFIALFFILNQSYEMIERGNFLGILGGILGVLFVFLILSAEILTKE
jgi:hypothetical protein